MKLANERFKRLNKALEYIGVSRTERDGAAALIKNAIWRGMSQSQAAGIINQLLHYIEPPKCWKHHCPEYGGVTCFCNCTLCQEGNLTPGRCKRYKEFKARQKAKNQKKREKIYETFKEQCEEAGCINYTGKFCPHIIFSENNSIERCKPEVKK